MPYRIGPIVDAIFDRGSVFSYAEYGGATVTALARLDGHPVGVLATDPYKGTTMSLEGAQAITRLVDLCETFHLPIVSLTDQGGITIGRVAEERGTIRYAARAIAAVYQARVPQAELIVRRVYGVAGAGMVNRHRVGRSWAWPSGDWGSLPVQGGVEAAFRAQLAGASDPSAEIERIRRTLAAVTSPFRTAERFGVQDLIDPRESRPLLCEWVRDAYRVLPELTGGRHSAPVPETERPGRQAHLSATGQPRGLLPLTGSAGPSAGLLPCGRGHLVQRRNAQAPRRQELRGPRHRQSGRQPATSAMWVGRDGDDLLFSTVEGRVEHRNMLRDPRVSVTILDSADPENYVELRGRVSITPDIGRKVDTALSWKYQGKDPDPDRPGAVRVIVRMNVDRATGYAA